MSATEVHIASRDAAVGKVDMHLEVEIIPVSDIEAAHDELAGRGIDASEIWHGPPFPPEARQPGPDPERTSYGSFFSFNDPDGVPGEAAGATRPQERVLGNRDPTISAGPAAAGPALRIGSCGQFTATGRLPTRGRAEAAGGAPILLAAKRTEGVARPPIVTDG